MKSRTMCVDDSLDKRLRTSSVPCFVLFPWQCHVTAISHLLRMHVCPVVKQRVFSVIFLNNSLLHLLQGWIFISHTYSCKLQSCCGSMCHHCQHHAQARERKLLWASLKIQRVECMMLDLVSRRHCSIQGAKVEDMGKASEEDIKKAEEDGEDVYIGFEKGDYDRAKGRKGRVVKGKKEDYPDRNDFTGGWAGGEKGLQEFLKKYEVCHLYSLIGECLVCLSCITAKQSSKGWSCDHLVQGHTIWEWKRL